MTEWNYIVPPDKHIPGSAKEWLARAKGDLALARVPLPEEAFYEDLCYHAQQAAEKALKAAHLHYGFEFRFTHDLEELIASLKRRGISIPKPVEEAVSLSIYATEARYPGLDEPVTKEEHEQAIALAQVVVNWAEKQIN